MDRSVDKAELKAFNDELESLGCQVRKLLNQIRPNLNLTSDQTRWLRSQGTVWPPFVRFLQKCLIFPQLISKLWCKIYRCVLNWFVQWSASTQVGFPIISDKSLTIANPLVYWNILKLYSLFNGNFSVWRSMTWPPFNNHNIETTTNFQVFSIPLCEEGRRVLVILRNLILNILYNRDISRKRLDGFLIFQLLKSLLYYAISYLRERLGSTFFSYFKKLFLVWNLDRKLFFKIWKKSWTQPFS